MTPSVDATSYSAERCDEEVTIQSEVALAGERVSRPLLQALPAPTYLLRGESVVAAAGERARR